MTCHVQKTQTKRLTAKDMFRVPHVDLIPQLLEMRALGGGFAGKLAEAWLNADAKNSMKLVIAFGSLLETFDCER